MHTKSTQELAAAAAATCGQGSVCRNNAHSVTNILNAFQKNILVHEFHIGSKRQVLSCCASVFENDNKEIQVTTSAAANKNEECLDKDAEILRLTEERRSMPKEEKQRLKDLSKSIKNASEKKRMKRQQDIERILEEFKGVRNIPKIKTAKKRVLITKIKNEKKVNASPLEKELPMLLENSTKDFSKTVKEMTPNMK